MADQSVHCRICGAATPHRISGDEDSGRMAQCLQCGNVHSLADPPPPVRDSGAAPGPPRVP